MSQDHPNYNIAEIGQYSEKRFGNMRRLSVIQTPVKDYQLTFVCEKLAMSYMIERNRIASIDLVETEIKLLIT